MEIDIDPILRKRLGSVFGALPERLREPLECKNHPKSSRSSAHPPQTNLGETGSPLCRGACASADGSGMLRMCGARTRRGGRCRRSALPGKLRCRRHGGLSTGPRSLYGKANTIAALQAGRGRWLQRMRLAKQEGLIERFPNGRRARPRAGPRACPTPGISCREG